jgi:hypothetical protein
MHSAFIEAVDHTTNVTAGTETHSVAPTSL